MSEAPLYTAVALDPGGVSGWAVFAVYDIAMRSSDYKILDNISMWSAGEFIGPISRQVREMLDLLQAWPDAKIIVEQFVLRKMTMDPAMLDPVRVTSGLEVGLDLTRRRGEPARPLILQQPALAMTTMTDDRLAAIGYAERLAGKPHAKDAVRHALTYLRRAKSILQSH